jgi:hypothetical protein
MKNIFIKKMSEIQKDYCEIQKKLENKKQEIRNSLIENLKEAFKDIFERNEWINHIQFRYNEVSYDPPQFEFYINNANKFGIGIYDGKQKFKNLERKSKITFKELEDTFSCTESIFFHEAFDYYDVVKIRKDLKIQKRRIL